MANKKLSKGQSEQVYSHRAPTNPRTLGATRNHDHPVIPSSTFRTIDQVIPINQMRTEENWSWNPRTGKGKIAREPVDLMDHARRAMTRGQFQSVTSGYIQRFEREEDRRGKSTLQSSMATPSPLGVRRKDRY
jgi:hypothetical protein